MKKTLIILFLLQQTVLHAFSFMPGAAAASALVLSHNLSLEDNSVPVRTSTAVFITLDLASFTFSERHSLSAGLKAGRVSASIIHENTYLLASRRLGSYIAYSCRLGSFSLGCSTAAGFGVTEKQDISFAFVEAGLSGGIFIDSSLIFSLGFDILYRREFLETHISVSMKLMVPQGIIG